MRLGRLEVRISYVVDLDNRAMVEHAQDCCCEDLDAAVKFPHETSHLRFVEDPTLTEADIPDFLKVTEEDP